MKRLCNFLPKPILNFKNVKTMKDRFSIMKNLLDSFDVPFASSNDFDFFKMEVLYQSLSNKIILEKTYEKLRNDNFDAWEHLDYQEKKNLINITYSSIKSEMLYFVYNDKLIRIAFFDELLNSLYENEMIIFEKKQFFHLESEFSKRIIDINYYSYLPYKYGFSSAIFLDSLNSAYILFSNETKCLYHIYNDLIDTYQLNHYIKDFEITELRYLAKTILTNDDLLIAKRFRQSSLFSPKYLRKIEKYINKYENI